jgi:hypothetical protein
MQNQCYSSNGSRFHRRGLDADTTFGQSTLCSLKSACLGRTHARVGVPAHVFIWGFVWRASGFLTVYVNFEVFVLKHQGKCQSCEVLCRHTCVHIYFKRESKRNTIIEETPGTACATTCTCQIRRVHRARAYRHRRVHPPRTRRRGRVRGPAHICGHTPHSQHAPDLSDVCHLPARTPRQACALLCAHACPGVACCFLYYLSYL